MDLKIRPAQAGDAAFLSWVILTAGRAHVKKRIWEVILGESEEKCLYFLKQLSVTKIPHYFHYTCYLLAETGGRPVAGLGGYDPAVLGDSALWQALPEVLSRFRGKAQEDSAFTEPPKILNCIPDSLENAWLSSKSQRQDWIL